MKRVLSLLLLMACLLSLAACGEGEPAPTEATQPTTQPTTAFTTVPTTAPTTELTTVPTTEPTTVSATQPTTGSTAEPTTELTTVPTTAPNTVSTTAATTKVTTKGTTAATTTAKPTTAKPTTAPTTKVTTAKPTTAKPTTSKPTTAKPTTAPTTQPQQLKILCESFDWVSWSNGEIIAVGQGGKYGAINTKGEVIVPIIYDGIKCPSTDGYVVVYYYSSETLELVEDEYPDTGNGLTEKDRYNEEYFVYNAKGQIVYQTDYLYEIPFSQYDEDDRFYYYGLYKHLDGTAVLSCNEGIIVTGYYVYSEQWDEFGIMGSDVVKHITMRRTDGTIIKEFDNVTYCSTMINGKMVIAIQREDVVDPFVSSVYCIIVDKNGDILKTIDYGVDIASGIVTDTNWIKNGINNGYFMAYKCSGMNDAGHVSWSPVICSMTSNECYLNFGYLGEDAIKIGNWGTLFASQVYNADDGGRSKQYYLIDAVKCNSSEIDSLITIEAAVSQTGYDYMDIPSVFGQDVKYALVGRDGKWGYLSLDGKTEKLYEDAGFFYGGLAIVKDETGVYVIDENFNKVSNTLTGYDSISSLGKGVYQVKKDGVAYLAVYNP